MADSSLSEEEKKAAEAEIAEIKKQEEDFRKKEAELEVQLSRYHFSLLIVLRRKSDCSLGMWILLEQLR